MRLHAASIDLVSVVHARGAVSWIRAAASCVQSADYYYVIIINLKGYKSHVNAEYLLSVCARLCMSMSIYLCVLAHRSRRKLINKLEVRCVWIFSWMGFWCFSIKTCPALDYNDGKLWRRVCVSEHRV